MIVRDLLSGPGWRVGPAEHGAIGPFPLIGSFNGSSAIYLGFVFLLGMSARLCQDRLPITGWLAAAAVLVVALGYGGFIAVGMPAFVYLVLYAASRLTGRSADVGRRRDYSYGVSLYGFPVQQMLALVGFGGRYGVTAYILASVAGTMALAVPSWHLIERPANRLGRCVQPRPVAGGAPEILETWAPFRGRDLPRSTTGVDR